MGKSFAFVKENFLKDYGGGIWIILNCLFRGKASELQLTIESWNF